MNDTGGLPTHRRQTAAVYDASPDFEWRRRQQPTGRAEANWIIGQLAAHVDVGSMVIDVGAGTGDIALRIQRDGRPVVLLDLSFRSLCFARERMSRTAANDELYVAGDAASLPFPSNIFQGVIVHGPLYHAFGKPDQHRMLAESVRVCAVGGVLILGVSKQDEITRSDLLELASFSIENHPVKTILAQKTR